MPARCASPLLLLLLLLVALAAGAPAPVRYDQRQEGDFNVHAHLENFVVVLIPATSGDGFSIIDYLKKAGSNVRTVEQPTQDPLVPIEMRKDEVKSASKASEESLAPYGVARDEHSLASKVSKDQLATNGTEQAELSLPSEATKDPLVPIEMRQGELKSALNGSEDQLATNGREQAELSLPSEATKDPQVPFQMKKGEFKSASKASEGPYGMEQGELNVTSETLEVAVVDVRPEDRKQQQQLREGQEALQAAASEPLEAVLALEVADHHRGSTSREARAMEGRADGCPQGQFRDATGVCHYVGSDQRVGEQYYIGLVPPTEK